MSLPDQPSQTAVIRNKTLALLTALALVGVLGALTQSKPNASTSTITNTPTFTATPTSTATPASGQWTVTVGADPPWLAFSVDAVTYYTPTTFNWDVNSQHTISTISPQAGGVLESRFSFNNWSDGGAQTHVVIANRPATYTAQFRNQYLLQMCCTNLYDLVSPGSGFYDQGQSVGLTAFTRPGSSFGFWGWQGYGVGSYTGYPGQTPATVTMNGPITEYAIFEGPNLTATATPTATPTATATQSGIITVSIGTNPSGLLVTIDGTSYVETKNFNWAVGTEHTLSVPAVQADVSSRSRFSWNSWSDGGGQTHTITATQNALVTANYGRQYMLEVCCSGPNGTANPGGDFHFPGESIQITAAPSVAQTFLGWTGSGNGSYTGLNNHATIVMGTNGIIQTANFTGPTATATSTPSVTATPTGTRTITNTPTITPTFTPTPQCEFQDFSNNARVNIIDNAAGSPYPSNITVAGLTGTITNVTVTLIGVSHTFPDDIDTMLVGPGGQSIVLMSDAGGGSGVANVDLQFDDAAPTTLYDATQVVGGTFKPTNFDPNSDTFPVPAPSPGQSAVLALFNGTNPNGIWSLYVRDDTGLDIGSISGGWTVHVEVSNGCITPTATATATPTGTVPSTPPPMSPSPTPFAWFQGPYFEDESQVAAITIYRLDDPNVPYGVNFTTTNGTATGGVACTAGIDYIFANQFLSFAAGETTKTVNIALCADNVTEQGETVNLLLNNAFPLPAVLTINDTATQFENPSTIAIGRGTSAIGYPSSITVSGAATSIGSMRVTLYDFECSIPDDTDFLLVGPQGRNIVLMADAGGNTSGGRVTLNFSDSAAAVVPDNGPLSTQDFEPTSYGTVANFPFPAPSGPYHEPGGTIGGTGTQTLIGNFGGTNPNGTWSLYVRNQTQTSPLGTVIGNVKGGWGIEFVAPSATPTDTPTNTATATLTATNTATPTPTLTATPTAFPTLPPPPQTFANLTPICTTLGSSADLYPSNITVSGGPTSLGTLRVVLNGITRQVPDNLDVLLVSPTGAKYILMADAGGTAPIGEPGIDLTFGDPAGRVLPDSTAPVTSFYEPTSWEPGQASFPLPAPPGPYNEPGSEIGGTRTQTLEGTFGGINANGTWSLYVRDDRGTVGGGGTTGCIDRGWQLQFLPLPYAAISGRVTNANGQGIRGAKVVVTNTWLPEPLVTTTGSFGYYSFEGLLNYDTYVVTVSSQRYTFSSPSRIIYLSHNVTDADFIANPQE